ncbi:hypothetical protein ACM01_40830 [Streptomyces viridochromogenes]|uniref:OsmC family protein n=1 Tax=Streptomyces viridochromogenes TaxID=1938 RepID=A0A0J7YWV1_STRVR|nr:OsmC family protein [Streptomyces viridochromogenes]KMS67952.1 hypothetical protein ACM01_40830 [Streptomyces viridochromogenes]KOG10508.1 hypothetical protein ADK35_37850 [Streptomyces viridochromogenes]KOG18612.1 hypothetical protein ADK36_21675 [Streptomyces viridochromogenes]
MRNSFNIASFSELVQETKEDPEKAQFYYGARARYLPHRGVRVFATPALLGGVKSARRFGFDVAEPAAHRLSDEPTPMEMALTGIASCSVKSTIAGGSSRNVNFDALAMTISAQLVPGGDEQLGAAKVAELSCELTAQTDTAGTVLAEIAAQVAERSPNHRTATDKTETRFLLGGRPVPLPSDDTPAPDTGGSRSVARHVTWLSGAQLESRDASGKGGVLRVDQPKQLAGVDWGPNPQEYLVMAAAADIAQLAGRAQQLRTGESGEWVVEATGHLDIRGLMNVDPTAPIGLQTVIFTLRAPDGMRSADAVADVCRAAAASAVVDLIARPHPAAVHVG